MFKYYENMGICYILYYLDIHQKELKSIQPVLLNPGGPLLFVARSTFEYEILIVAILIESLFNMFVFWVLDANMETAWEIEIEKKI